jgi:hypothetical protein
MKVKNCFGISELQIHGQPSSTRTAAARGGDHLSVTNERVEFQRRLTDGEIARLRLNAGEVKRFE